MGKQKGGRSKGVDVTKDFVTGSHSLSETITVFVENNKPINVTEKELIATVGSEGVFALRRGGKLDAYMKLCTNWHQGQCHNSEQCSFAHVKDYFSQAPMSMMMMMMPPQQQQQQHGGSGGVAPMHFHPAGLSNNNNNNTSALSSMGNSSSGGGGGMFTLSQQQHQNRAWAPAALVPDSATGSSTYKATSSAWGGAGGGGVNTDLAARGATDSAAAPAVAGISVWGVTSSSPSTTVGGAENSNTSMWSVLGGDTQHPALTGAPSASTSLHAPWGTAPSSTTPQQQHYSSSSSAGFGGFSDLSANSPPFQPSSLANQQQPRQDPLAAFLSAGALVSPGKQQRLEPQAQTPSRGSTLWGEAPSSSGATPPHSYQRMMTGTTATSSPSSLVNQQQHPPALGGSSGLYSYFPGLVAGSSPPSDGMPGSSHPNLAASELVGSGVLSSMLLDGTSPVASSGGSPTTVVEPGNAQLSHLMSLLTAGM